MRSSAAAQRSTPKAAALLRFCVATGLIAQRRVPEYPREALRALLHFVLVGREVGVHDQDRCVAQVEANLRATLVADIVDEAGGNLGGALKYPRR